MKPTMICSSFVLVLLLAPFSSADDAQWQSLEVDPKEWTTKWST